MYNYLKGILTYKDIFSLNVECGGIGFDVKIPLSTYEKLPPLNTTVKILIHFTMNDDGIRLFGFLTEKEREMFRNLILINRVGPKLGLAILSGLSVDELIEAILMNNIKLISSIPGLGKKSAERLIIELKDKIPKFASIQDLDVERAPLSNLEDDAINALVTLGHKQNEAYKMVSKLIKENHYDNSESLIKEAIRELYKKG